TFSTLCRSNGPFNQSGCRDGVLIATSPVNIKKNEYVGVHTYPGAPPNGFFIISFFDMNRIDGINNIDGGQSVNIPFFVEDTLKFPTDISNIGFNSSPVLRYPP